MNASVRKYASLSVSFALIVICSVALLVIDRKATGRRNMPGGSSLPVVRLGSQAEAYTIFRDRRIRGAHIVHFGRHFHLIPYIPQDETVPVPFPIAVYDMRPVYEKKIDSHNWLFIANKAGFVRKATAVLPDSDFQEKTEALDSDFSFRRWKGGYRGYSFDMPRAIFPMSSFECGPGPVVVNVDAGAFGNGIGPGELHSALLRQCRDVRLVLLIDSRDEDSVTDGMRRDLTRFEELIAQDRT
jgi:hypothetical protein